MLAVVPPKRRDGNSSFVKLVSYTVCREDVNLSETLSPDNPTFRLPRSEEAIFNNLVSYATRNALPDSDDVIAMFPDGRQQVKFDKVVCETNCFSLASAASEMNMVAMQNARCKDPVYHTILSWPEGERPTHDQIFESARHCLKGLGMADHQYVFAIHDDTDNLHVHLSVNRVNPVTYKAASLYNDHFVLDRCCREMELKHQWKHDNGPYRVNDQDMVVRNKNFYKPAPAAARRLEFFSDKESLHTYAVDHCRDKIETLLMSDQQYQWDDIHDVFHAAGLELRQKGTGLAIYDINDDSQIPLRASRLHPELTLADQQEHIGAFELAPKRDDAPGRLVQNCVPVESLYDSLLHCRDRGARAERRIARAEAREDLIGRYKSYKNGFVRPDLSKDDMRTRFREVAAEYRVRKNHVRLVQRDPLLRKLMYRALEVDKMKAMSALKIQIRTERDAIKASPDARPLSYRAWVEVQASQLDAAAVSQLRGWAYRQQRQNRTAPISGNVFLNAVADDVKPATIRGYETTVKRDGAVVYSSGGKPVLMDRGVLIEVADAPEERGKNLAMAMHITAQKSGERSEIRGDTAFVRDAIGRIPHFNSSSGKTVPLTHPVQRQWAGYDAPKPAEEKQVVPQNAAPRYTPPKPQ
ncbi:DNA relaxase [Buttiauxella noackiae ATCC 51607]|uniref:DNA relaxase n=1 Tax=Buttiauxella noackiae ATCC 51607 TaxID=1354255 RepID=A0A1B7HG92_9ENTR|nr:TraI/MobA(P) family conjugative relaxase [Buttiauxella noackiae]OAT14658.1 DNA relaxase [Buttiauxella noackiae ATCC 51607]